VLHLVVYLFLIPAGPTGQTPRTVSALKDSQRGGLLEARQSKIMPLFVVLVLLSMD
jgi:hypothetical protein